MRIPIVKWAFLYLALCCLALTGCGGGGGGGYSVGVGEASGLVLDQNGNIVRNAQVYFSLGGQNNTVSTVTNSNGAYVLKGLPALDDLIQCQVVSNGVTYEGQNLAQLSNGQRTMSVNIGIYPSTSLGAISGTVSDSQGNLLYGAKIYAIPANGSALTSAYGVTDYTGHYFIGGLLAGTAYNIQVNALGYNSTTDKQTLTAGQNLSLNYTITSASATTLAAPTDVSAIAYTAPAEVTTAPKIRAAIEAVKNLMNPGRKGFVIRKTKRPTTGANPSSIEIDLTWTPISNASLLGYGIYRSSGTAPLANVDFYGDPLGSLYEDMSWSLNAGTTYNYAVSTISTSYTGTAGESPLSATVTATPLGALTYTSATASANPTFSWQPVAGAATYAVYLFSQYPSIGVTDIYDNFNSPTSATSLVYPGPALTSGQTYYYIVVGISSSGSQSISSVGQFSVP